MDNVRRERIRRKGKNENKSERKINLKKIEIKEGNRKKCYYEHFTLLPHYTTARSCFAKRFSQTMILASSENPLHRHIDSYAHPLVHGRIRVLLGSCLCLPSGETTALAMIFFVSLEHAMTSEFCAILSFFLPVIIGRLSSTMCQYNMQISYRLVKKNAMTLF
jgi:hypothetical protein